MKIKGTIVLTIISLLERFGYYGVRTILILYIADQNFLNLDNSQTLNYYGHWPSLLMISAIPLGLITDKFLGQKRSIYIGGILSLLGYFLLNLQNNFTFIIALILILIGTNFAKTSTTILIGRQYKKENKRRTLAFIIFFTGINIGAFLGVVGIGYISETYNWRLGFTIAGITTLTYVLITSFFKSQIIEIETNIISSPKFEFTLKKSMAILPLLIVINMVFWKGHEIESTKLIEVLSMSEEDTVFDINMLKSMYSALTTIWTLPLTILVFIYWYFKGVTDVFKSIKISLSILIMAIATTVMFNNVEINNLLQASLIPLAMFALADVIISPILASFVTRISDINYSNTIYSLFVFLTYIIGKGFVLELQSDIQTYLTIAILTIAVFGLIIFRNKIKELTVGLK